MTSITDPDDKPTAKRKPATKRRRVRLIPDWRQAWRFLSVQAAAILAILSALQSWLPQAQAFIPAHTFSIVTLVLSGLVIMLRVIKQFNDGDEARP